MSFLVEKGNLIDLFEKLSKYHLNRRRIFSLSVFCCSRSHVVCL